MGVLSLGVVESLGLIIPKQHQYNTGAQVLVLITAAEMVTRELAFGSVLCCPPTKLFKFLLLLVLLKPIISPGTVVRGAIIPISKLFKIGK